jgi:hypothetical protein
MASAKACQTNGAPSAPVSNAFYRKPDKGRHELPLVVSIEGELA